MGYSLLVKVTACCRGVDTTNSSCRVGELTTRKYSDGFCRPSVVGSIGVDGAYRVGLGPMQNAEQILVGRS